MSRSCSSASGCSDAVRQASRNRGSALRVSPCSTKRAGERELSSLRDRLVAGEGADGREVRMLLPQHHLGAPAEHAGARPVRIGGEEGLVAREIGGVVVAAQDRPFDELAGERIGDALLEVGRVSSLAAAREREGVVGGGEIGCRRGDGRRRQRLAGRLGRIERSVNGTGRERLPALDDGGRFAMLHDRLLTMCSGEARPRTGQGDVLGDGRRIHFVGRLRKRIDRPRAARSERDDACCRAERQSITVTPGQVFPRPDWPHLPLGCNG